MRDIYLGLALVAGLSGALFVISMKLSRRLSRAAALVALGASVTALVAFSTVLRDSLLVARWLPVSNVMVVGNGQPLAVAILAGLAWPRMGGDVGRRCMLLAALVVACAYRVSGPLTGDVPPLGLGKWKDGVCRQTSAASCSAAAAATLLAECGIPASEVEMADLCLTRQNGTSMLGLYRGLKLKTTATAWHVEPFRCSLDELRAGVPPPAVLSVRLDNRAGVDRRYEAEWGWAPGVTHTVVLFGFTPDGREVEIGDPAAGREHWRVEDLRVLWHGEGVQLVRQ